MSIVEFRRTRKNRWPAFLGKCAHRAIQNIRDECSRRIPRYIHYAQTKLYYFCCARHHGRVRESEGVGISLMDKIINNVIRFRGRNMVVRGMQIVHIHSTVARNGSHSCDPLMKIRFRHLNVGLTTKPQKGFSKAWYNGFVISETFSARRISSLSINECEGKCKQSQLPISSILSFCKWVYRSFSEIIMIVPEMCGTYVCSKHTPFTHQMYSIINCIGRLIISLLAPFQWFQHCPPHLSVYLFRCCQIYYMRSLMCLVAFETIFIDNTLRLLCQTNHKLIYYYCYYSV